MIDMNDDFDRYNGCFKQIGILLLSIISACSIFFVCMSVISLFIPWTVGDMSMTLGPNSTAPGDCYECKQPRPINPLEAQTIGNRQIIGDLEVSLIAVEPSTNPIAAEDPRNTYLDLLISVTNISDSPIRINPHIESHIQDLDYYLDSGGIPKNPLHFWNGAEDLQPKETKQTTITYMANASPLYWVYTDWASTQDGYEEVWVIFEVKP